MLKVFIKQALIISILILGLSSTARADDPKILNMVFVPASEKGDDNDYQSLIRIISEQAKVVIKTIRVTDYNAAVEAMRAGRAHIAWFGGKTYIKAAEIAHAEAFAAGVRRGDENAGYYSYFVVRSDSPLKSIDNIKGKTLGLNSIGSTSGDLIPRVELVKFGLNAKIKGNFKQVVYAGSHDACLLSVINKQVDVCGMSSRNFDARIKDGTITIDQVRIIHRSPLVPPPPLAYSRKLSSKLRNRIKEATLTAHEYGKIGGYGGEMSHYIAVSDHDYNTLRDIEKMLK
ncbi:phosphate/phosphite/phosphonate ABC transporter substrate-binding protein [Alphaproteobacteria bacterium]|nr:phosphate/phosphite/phosphonate ABC transporter substrate-binding protein [Alphaproteobacteria bacterium]